MSIKVKEKIINYPVISFGHEKKKTAQFEIIILIYMTLNALNACFAVLWPAVPKAFFSLSRHSRDNSAVRLERQFQQ